MRCQVKKTLILSKKWKETKKVSTPITVRQKQSNATTTLYKLLKKRGHDEGTLKLIIYVKKKEEKIWIIKWLLKTAYGIYIFTLVVVLNQKRNLAKCQ